MCYNGYHISFYFWLIRSAPKHYKVPKYYEQNRLRIFFCSLHFQWWFKFLQKNAHLVQKSQIYHKKPTSNSESSQESILIQTNYAKHCLHKTIKFGSLMQLACFIFFLKIEQMLWWYTKYKKINVWRRLDRINTKNSFAQAIRDKIFGTK